jgi:hypothetical protein
MLIQRTLLALKSDVLGPFYHAREVALGLDVLADTEVARALLDQRVLVVQYVSQRRGNHQGDGGGLTLAAFFEPAFP